MNTEIIIESRERLRDRMMLVWQLVNRGIEGGPVTVALGRASKSRDQERKYHAMIRDIAKQVTFFGRRRYDPEVWKALLVDHFEQEKLAMGEPLTHPGQLITSMDGRRTITVRPSTTKFRKAEAAEFIEFLYQQGTEMGVQWSDPALAVYEEYRRERAA